MRLLSVLMCFFFMATNALAQDSTIQYREPRVILKLAPLSWLDPDATVQGAVEIRVSSRNAVQVELGYGQKGWQITTDDKKDFLDWSIWRVRSEYRHYTNRYRTNTRKGINIRSPFPLGNYWAVEGFAKQIAAKRLTTDGVVRVAPQLIDRYVLGSHVKWGRQIAIPGASPGASRSALSRVLLDFYVGLGMRYGKTDVNFSRNECGCGPIDSRFKEGARFGPSLAAGVKIGFGL